LAHRLSHPLGVDQVLDSALETLGELLHLDTGWAWLWNESTSTARLAAKRNLPPGLVKHPELMEGGCHCLWTYAAGDLHGAANVNVVACSRLAKLVADRRELRCHASVPLYVDDRRLGILNVASADWRELTTDELHLLSTVGALVSLAIERTRLAERGAELAAAEERNRIARDIHDTIAQSLAAVTMQLESADAFLEATNPPRAADAVRRALGLTRSALEEARRSVVELRTSPIAGRGLLSALRALPDELAATAGKRIDVEFEAGPIDELIPTAVASGVYQIVREALTNVIRHANASTATVCLDVSDATLYVRVADDGDGFEVERVPAQRFGLVGMVERARLLGGQLAITSDAQAEQGTVVAAEIPLDRHRVEAT
jgi:two-component system NarL family sensor kinase